MAIEVRIPTILRTYTGGEKAVEGSGSTLTALLDDLIPFAALALIGHVLTRRYAAALPVASTPVSNRLG